MSVKSMWIPKSETGRNVVRTLKMAGHPATYANTTGRFVCNLQFDLDAETLRAIAYDIDPEAATSLEENAYAIAENILDDPAAYGIHPDTAQSAASQARIAWLWQRRDRDEPQRDDRETEQLQDGERLLRCRRNCR